MHRNGNGHGNGNGNGNGNGYGPPNSNPNRTPRYTPNLPGSRSNPYRGAPYGSMGHVGAYTHHIAANVRGVINGGRRLTNGRMPMATNPSLGVSVISREPIYPNATSFQQAYHMLVSHENFPKGRSPFFLIKRRVCVMPVFSLKRIQFRITLSEDDLRMLANEHISKAMAIKSRSPEDDEKLDSQETKKQKKKRLKNEKKVLDESIYAYKLHLRLFSHQTFDHEDWAKSCCEVSINDKKIPIIRARNKTKAGESQKKKKKYIIVRPLNISAHKSESMDFEITSNGTFMGIAVIELVKETHIDEMVRRIIARSSGQDKKCQVCEKDDDILRCSRCKSVWYCGTDHQAKDWPSHQSICIPIKEKPKLKEFGRIKKDKDMDKMDIDEGEGDEIICAEQRVSLRCPLSVVKIKTPVRGCNCLHPQCMDLESFLSFCHLTGKWQCPSCNLPLKYDDLVVDEVFNKIIKEVESIDSEADQVSLNPHGGYEIFTIEDQRKQDARSQEIRQMKKQKQNGQRTTNSRKRKTPTNGFETHPHISNGHARTSNGHVAAAVARASPTPIGGMECPIELD